MEVYTVVRVFGVDAVKVRVYAREEDAQEEINENIRMLSDENTDVEIREDGNETYYIINKSDDPTEYNEIIFRRTIIR